MPAAKTRTSLFSGVTLTASNPDTTSSTVNLATGYGAQVNIKLTNGGTGPTIAAQVQIQVANDAAGTLFVNFGGPLVGGVANNGISSWSVELPIGVAAVKLVAGSNTGQNVTVDADVDNVTAI